MFGWVPQAAPRCTLASLLALAPARACRCVVPPFRFFTRACCSAALQWQVVSLIYAGKAAYSLVVPLTNTTIGVVYERA